MLGLLVTFVAFGLLFTLVYGGITAQEMAVRLNFPVTPLLLSFAGLGMFLTLISVLLIGAKRERPKNKRTQDDFTDYSY